MTARVREPGQLRDDSEAPVWAAKAVIGLSHSRTYSSAHSCFLSLLSTGVVPEASNMSCMLNFITGLLPQPMRVHKPQTATGILLPLRVRRTLPYLEHFLSSPSLQRLHNYPQVLSDLPLNFSLTSSPPTQPLTHSAPATPSISNTSDTFPPGGLHLLFVPSA